MVLGLCTLAFSGAPAFAGGDDGNAELHGTIEQLPASGFVGDWRVSGRTIHVDSSTRIKQEHGHVAVGAAVEVKGDQRGDGSIDANTVEVESGASSGSDDGSDDVNELHGTIEQLPQSGLVGDWRVSGRVVRVTGATSIEQEHGQAVVGAAVEVKGAPQSDGSLAASRIEVNPTNGGGSTGGEATFFGTVQSFPQSGLVGLWMVSDRAVRVSDSTTIEREHGATPGVGSYVKVEGSQQTDGSIAARSVEVKTGSGSSSSNASAGYIEFKSTVDALPGGVLVGEWMIGGRQVFVTSATLIRQKKGQVRVGALVEVRGNLRADGSVDAGAIEVKSTSGGRSRASRFYGTIQDRPTSGVEGIWVVGGRTVNVTSATVIEQNFGQAAVGAYVEVKGGLRADGSFSASKIEVKSGAGSSVGSSGYIEFKGTVESLPASGSTGDWMVSGRRVHVSAGTRLRERNGRIRVGAYVEVEGNQRTDGSVDAAKVDVKN